MAARVTISRTWTWPRSASRYPRKSTEFVNFPSSRVHVSLSFSQVRFKACTWTTGSAVLAIRNAPVAHVVPSTRAVSAAHATWSIRFALESLGTIVLAALFGTIAGAHKHASGVFSRTLHASGDITACSPKHRIREQREPMAFPIAVSLSVCLSPDTNDDAVAAIIYGHCLGLSASSAQETTLRSQNTSVHGRTRQCPTASTRPRMEVQFHPPSMRSPMAVMTPDVQLDVHRRPPDVHLDVQLGVHGRPVESSM